MRFPRTTIARSRRQHLAAWLTEHPSVAIVARDRSGLYADGAATGSPQALQVADRLHLILNLSAAIERVLEERSRELLLPGKRVRKVFPRRRMNEK